MKSVRSTPDVFSPTTRAAKIRARRQTLKTRMARETRVSVVAVDFFLVASTVRAMTAPPDVPAPDQFAQLLEAITSSQTTMEQRFTEFRDEVRQGQEDAAAKALKRASLEKPYTFRRKGNEEQAVFNGRLDETVTGAEAELAAAPTSVAQSQGILRARETLNKGRNPLAERQKLIRIADWSGVWWRNTQRTSWLTIRGIRKGSRRRRRRPNTGP